MNGQRVYIRDKFKPGVNVQVEEFSSWFSQRICRLDRVWTNNEIVELNRVCESIFATRERTKVFHEFRNIEKSIVDKIERTNEQMDDCREGASCCCCWARSSAPSNSHFRLTKIRQEIESSLFSVSAWYGDFLSTPCASSSFFLVTFVHHRVLVLEENWGTARALHRSVT